MFLTRLLVFFGILFYFAWPDFPRLMNVKTPGPLSLFFTYLVLLLSARKPPSMLLQQEEEEGPASLCTIRLFLFLLLSPD